MSDATTFGPVEAVTGKAVELSMQRLWLTGQVLPVGARLVVEHVFRSGEANPLEVIYAFPLPRDAALRSFRITGEGFEAHSELKATKEAVRVYEEAIADGSLTALAREYGDGVVNLTVGNIRPRETVTVHLEILCGVELRDDGFRFRFPFTLAPAYHSQAKAMVTAPGEGEMELPVGDFGDMILPRFRENPSALHQVGFELTVVSQLALDEIGSPSHAVRVRQDRGHCACVTLATEKDVPNRDLVLDARYQSTEAQVLAGRDKRGIGRFAAILPSSSFGTPTEASRRVVILLDRSGSMEGEPIAQARRAIGACLGALSDADAFGLVAFDHEVSMFQPALVSGTREWRDRGHEFLKHIDARGGTELAAGVLKAAKLLEGGGGDILILTDGQVSGTEEILSQARSAGVRLHCLGIGSASQDRFLTLLARESGGVSRFVTARERVDLSAVHLFASVGRPVASGLTAGAKIQPPPPSLVFSGTPVILFGETDQTGEMPVELKWDGGELNLPVTLSATDIAETLWLLQGSRLITDWESRYRSADARAPLEKRKRDRVAARLLELSRTYGLASREMAMVAVAARPGDRPGELPYTQVVPVGLPQDMEFQSYFRSLDSSDMPDFCRVMRSAGPPIESSSIDSFLSHSALAAPADRPARRRDRLLAASVDQPLLTHTEAVTVEDTLLDLASRMDSDGGMPAGNPESRAIATVIAVLAFLSQGHTTANGAFRVHVARLASFLKTLTDLSKHQQEIIAAVMELVCRGTAPAGDWVELARTSDNHWRQVEEAVLHA